MSQAVVGEHQDRAGRGRRPVRPTRLRLPVVDDRVQDGRHAVVVEVLGAGPGLRGAGARDAGFRVSQGRQDRVDRSGLVAAEGDLGAGRVVRGRLRLGRDDDLVAPGECGLEQPRWRRRAGRLIGARRREDPGQGQHDATAVRQKGEVPVAAAPVRDERLVLQFGRPDMLVPRQRQLELHVPRQLRRQRVQGRDPVRPRRSDEEQIVAVARVVLDHREIVEERRGAQREVVGPTSIGRDRGPVVREDQIEGRRPAHVRLALVRILRGPEHAGAGEPREPPDEGRVRAGAAERDQRVEALLDEGDQGIAMPADLDPADRRMAPQRVRDGEHEVAVVRLRLGVQQQDRQVGHGRSGLLCGDVIRP